MESDTDMSLLNPDNEDEGVDKLPISPPDDVPLEHHKLMQVSLEEESELEIIVKELTRALADANELILMKQDQIEELRKRKGQLEQVRNSAESPSAGRSPLPLLPKQEDIRKLEKKEDNLAIGVPVAPELRFPEEIWEMIMKNLSDPKDLWNASNSCHLVQKVLNPKYLWIFDMVFPILFSYLDNEVILTFRLVCKRWNGVVDNHFENHPSLNAYSEENWDHQSPPFRTPMREKGIGVYSFSNRWEDQASDLRNRDFLSEMRHHPRNPFIGRSLIISKDTSFGSLRDTSDTDSDDAEVENGRARHEIQSIKYWRRVTQFLEVFGEHIWYLTFSPFDPLILSSSSGTGFIINFLIRGDVFYLCPNLRKLRVGGYLLTDYDYRRIALPSPHLASKLHTLHIDNGLFRNNTVPSTLVKNCFQQLKGLDVWGKRWRAVSHLDFSNLTELYLNMFNDNDGDLALLLDLKVANLKRLGLKLKGLTYDELELLFRVIIKLSETAPHFNTIRLYNGYSAEAVKMLPPHLYAPPNLTTLEFQCSSSNTPYANFAFLVRFIFLKNLNIYLPMPTSRLELGCPDLNYHQGGEMFYYNMCKKIGKKWKDEMIQVWSYMYVQCMHESNIWMLLSRLNVFTFQDDLYTRHAYEEFTSKLGNSVSTVSLSGLRWRQTSDIDIT